MDINLSFENRSNDPSGSSVVIFQKNVATSFNETAVAWKVIKNSAPGLKYPFAFPTEMSVSATDSYSAETQRLTAAQGQLFHLSQTAGGNELVYKGQASSAEEIQCHNDLQRDAVSVNIYRDGRLLAAQSGVAPAQKAAFQFEPTIHIGASAQVEEGQVINPTILSANTELSLLGIASADIVMTGGGPGGASLQFSLENVVMA